MGVEGLVRVVLVAAVALVGVAVCGMGVAHVVQRMPPNACRMSYSRPNYSRVEVKNMDTSRYTLFRYYERESERYLDTPRVPVLFVPGHRGSHRQVRSFASEVGKTYLPASHNVRFDWFTVEFNEEWVGVSGELMVQQSEFVAASVRQILRNYKRHMPADVAEPPQSVVVVAHSMGGVVARAALLTTEYVEDSINTIITLSTPHQRPVYQFDRTMGALYDQLNTFWRNETERVVRGWESPLKNVAVLSIAGGMRDMLVPDGWSTLEGLVAPEQSVSTTTLAMPNVGLSTDHLCALWCNQLVTALGRILYGIVDQEALTVRDARARAEVFRRLAKPWLGEQLGIAGGKARPPVRSEWAEDALASVRDTLADARDADGVLELRSGDMRRTPLWRFALDGEATQSFAVATTLDMRKHVDVFVCAGECTHLVQVHGPMVSLSSDGPHMLLITHSQLRAFDTLYLRVSARAHSSQKDAWLLAVPEGPTPRASDMVVNVPLSTTPEAVHTLKCGRGLLQRLRPQASLAATLPQRVVVRGEDGCTPAFSPLVVHSVGRMRREKLRNGSAEYVVTPFPDWPHTRASGWAIISDPRCAASVHMHTDVGALSAEWLFGSRHALQDALIVAAGLVAMLFGLDMHQHASSGLLRGVGGLSLRHYAHALGTALGVPLALMWVGEGVVDTPLQSDDGVLLVYNTVYMATVFVLACALVTIGALAVKLLVWLSAVCFAVLPRFLTWLLFGRLKDGPHITLLVFVSPLATTDAFALFTYIILWLRMIGTAGKCVRLGWSAAAGSAVQRALLTRARLLATLTVFYLLHSATVAGHFFFVLSELLHEWTLPTAIVGTANWALVPHLVLMFMATYFPIPRHQLGAETFKFLGVVASAAVGSLLVGTSRGWYIEYVFTAVASFWLLAELFRAENKDKDKPKPKKE